MQVPKETLEILSRWKHMANDRELSIWPSMDLNHYVISMSNSLIAVRTTLTEEEIYARPIETAHRLIDQFENADTRRESREEVFCGRTLELACR